MNYAFEVHTSTGAIVGTVVCAQHLGYIIGHVKSKYRDRLPYYSGPWALPEPCLFCRAGVPPHLRRKP